MARPLRQMLVQPFPEQRRHLVRQPQQGVTRPRGAGSGRLRQDLLQVHVGHGRNHRRDQHADRHPRRRQAGDGAQAAPRRRGARLKLRRQPVVEAGDRDQHRHQPVARHGGKQVEVALDHGALGDDGAGMARLGQHLQQLARHAIAFLDRLVGIGVGAEVDRGRPVAALRQRGAQQLGGIGLGVKLGLEVQPGRQVEIGVAGPRVAVDAAVLAAAIGIDGGVEGDVGRLVARDDAARALFCNRGGRPPRRVLRIREPAVVDRLARDALEAPLRIRRRAAPLHRPKARSCSSRRPGRRDSWSAPAGRTPPRGNPSPARCGGTRRTLPA